MSKKLLMNNYSENGLMPVTDGLICWLDARDLKDTNDGTIWKDKSGNSNHATLKRLNSQAPAIDNGYYRTYDSGYVILPSLNFNGTDGISVFLDFKVHNNSKQQYARLFTLGYADRGQAQFGLDVGWDEFGSIKCFNTSSWNYNFSYLKSGIYNKKINMSILCNEGYMSGNNYTDNIKKSFTIATQKFDQLFNYNYLNGSSPTFIKPVDASYGLILIYNRTLTEEEMEQNYLYEQSIERG